MKLCMKDLATTKLKLFAVYVSFPLVYGRGSLSTPCVLPNGENKHCGYNSVSCGVILSQGKVYRSFSKNSARYILRFEFSTQNFRVKVDKFSYI